MFYFACFGSPRTKSVLGLATFCLAFDLLFMYLMGGAMQQIQKRKKVTFLMFKTAEKDVNKAEPSLVSKIF